MTYERSGKTRVWNKDFAPIGEPIPPQNWTLFATDPQSRYAVVGETIRSGKVRVYATETGQMIAELEALVERSRAAGVTGLATAAMQASFSTRDPIIVLSTIGGLAHGWSPQPSTAL